MSSSADHISALQTISDVDADVIIDVLGQLSLLPILPSDVLLTILGLLSMRDMLAISRVSSAWRQLSIQTATLWWDLAILGDIPLTEDVNRFVFLLHRSGGTSISVNIAENPLRNASPVLLHRLRVALDANRHRIIAVRFPSAHLFSCRNGCSLIGSASWLLRGLGAQSFSSSLGNEPIDSCEVTYIPSFNLRAIRKLAIIDHQHTCPVSCPEVFDLEVSTRSNTIRSLERLIQQYPNTRVLTVRACGLGHEPGRILQLRDLAELRIMYDASGYVYWDALASFVMEPTIKRVVVNMSSSSRSFLQSIRYSLKRSLSYEPWQITFGSGATHWPQDSTLLSSDGVHGNKANFTITIKLEDGSERLFIFHKFGEALERMARPLLHDQRTTGVIVDGESALGLLYSGIGDSNMPHIQILTVVTSDDASLVVPLRRVALSRLKLVVLERGSGRGSQLTTGRVEAWLAALRLNEKPNLDLQHVYVYEEGGSILSAVLLGARLYRRSWRQTSPTLSV